MEQKHMKLTDCGEILTYFYNPHDFQPEKKPLSQLTLTKSGQILLNTDLQDKFKNQKNIVISSAFQRPEEAIYTFQDFIVNDGIITSQDEEGKTVYDYSQILRKLQDFYFKAQKYFEDPAQQVRNRNYYLLEYHLFHHLYIDSSNNTIHLVLFAPVAGKETLNSRIHRYPTQKPTPGQVLTLIKQVSGVLQFMFLEAEIYYGDDNSLPLFAFSPEISLLDVWFFGKLEYKLNLLTFSSKERLEGCIFSHKVKAELEGLRLRYKETNSKFTEDDKKVLYHISINSLAFSASKYVMNDVNWCSKNTFSTEPDDSEFRKDFELREVERTLTSNFLNEFKEEAELLEYVLKEMIRIASKDMTRKNFSFKKCLEESKGYQNTDPKQRTLVYSFERHGHGRPKRLEQIKEIALGPTMKREAELDYTKELVNKLLTKERYTAILGNEKKESNKTVKAKDQPKNIVYPYLEIEYPLLPLDVCNISPNSNEEKLICQIYPLFEKDFFVYRALTTQLVVSIEFNDDLILLLGALSEELGYINAEIDNDRRLVFRSALNLQPFENEMESHINTMDHLAITAILIIRKLNFCIEQEEFGRMAKNTKLIIEEIKYHLQAYREYCDQNGKDSGIL